MQQVDAALGAVRLHPAGIPREFPGVPEDFPGKLCTQVNGWEGGFFPTWTVGPLAVPRDHNPEALVSQLMGLCRGEERKDGQLDDEIESRASENFVNEASLLD